jgi:hypothetical protein
LSHSPGWDTRHAGYDAWPRKQFQQRIGHLAGALLHDVVVAALNTLAVRARTGASAAVLDALIDATVGVICARPD